MRITYPRRRNLSASRPFNGDVHRPTRTHGCASASAWNALSTGMHGAHRGTRGTPGRTQVDKTRPDRWVRARNEIGSGVRTLAVVRAVLTTIATLTTPLRHVILLGFVV